jgi:DNA polymerase-3 subunit alpha
MYSLLDGLSQPRTIAERCQEIGATSCALTDHGNIAGSVKFYTEMKKKGIKPILGCEIYVCDQDPKIKTKENKHLTLFITGNTNPESWTNTQKPTNFFLLKGRFFNLLFLFNYYSVVLYL